MPNYNLNFHHSIDTDEEHLLVGDAFRWEDAIWRVEEVEGDRVVMKPWPNGVDYPPRVKGASA